MWFNHVPCILHPILFHPSELSWWQHCKTRIISKFEFKIDYIFLICFAFNQHYSHRNEFNRDIMNMIINWVGLLTYFYTENRIIKKCNPFQPSFFSINSVFIPYNSFLTNQKYCGCKRYIAQSIVASSKSVY